MKIRKFNGYFRGVLILLVFALGFSACSAGSSELPTPMVMITSAPSIGNVAQDFLSAWEKEDYDSMYALLSQQSQATISKEDFINFYQNMVNNLTLQSLTAEVMHESTNPGTALIDYRANYQTSLFGEFERDLQMELVLENDQWRVQWENGLILPELKGGNSLALELQVPNRGSIFDRKGEPIVAQTEAYALGIVPGQIGEGQEGRLLSYLSQLTGKTTQAIQASYQNVGGDWYVAVGEASADEVNEIWNNLISLGGILLSPYTSRYYYNGGVAPQAIGYVLSISEENLEEYKRLGYLGDEKVGQAGLEKYAEDALAGKAEASLYVVDPNGQIVTRLNQSDPRPAQNITTTLDKELQLAAQQAIAGFSGAVVVMEVDTGRILAMASSPSIDPNLFDPENRNNEVLNRLLNDGSQRLLNRATQSGYPLGSVFKLITMAAALESDLYTPDSEYYCDYYFTELPGERFKDWTVDKELPPSGNLNLVNGLMRSCNPWFYHIGLDLFRQKGATFVSDMARGFGLGSATGIEQVAEDPGNIPDPKTDGDAVQLAIGQGETLVTPLQVVRFVAAIANGGTLYRPQIIEDMTTTTGVTVYSFTPQKSGELPISAETLEAIQEGMRRVIKSKSGTAYDALEGLNTPMYGKTGTATTSTDEPHSWFVGYTQTAREDKPDIAVAVIAENAGEGSEIAAPIFRRIVEVYYFGRPLRVYPWETIINVTRTPTLQYTLTPTETPYRPPQEVQPTDTPSG
jgi:penicillin-binding protein 2